MAKDRLQTQGANTLVFALKNVGISFLSTIVLLFLGAVAATYLALPEPVIRGMVMAIVGICILWSGFYGARRLRQKGFLLGAVSGLLYMGILYLIGTLVLGEVAFRMTTVYSLVMGIGCGAIGGILGVNGKRKTKKRR